MGTCGVARASIVLQTTMDAVLVGFDGVDDVRDDDDEQPKVVDSVVDSGENRVTATCLAGATRSWRNGLRLQLSGLRGDICERISRVGGF